MLWLRTLGDAVERGTSDNHLGSQRAPQTGSSPRSSVGPTSASSAVRARGGWWLAFLVLAAIEVGGHFVLQSRVVPDADWERAAARVRQDHRPGDLIVVAPSWADPLLRRELGDLISLEDAGRSDLAQYRRLWALSIRGHRPAEAPDAPAEIVEQFGRVLVLRWPLTHDAEVLYDFTEHVEDAAVTLRRGDADVPCRWSVTRPRAGGLGGGAAAPAARHDCDPRRPWLYVAATIQDDLELRPRYCVYQHPAGTEPIRATFSDVPLGDELVLYGDIYYEHERDLEHGPVVVTVEIDGETAGQMTHRDGDGWKRMVASTRPLGGGERRRGEVTIEVTAPDPHLRTFCWAATTRAESTP